MDDTTSFDAVAGFTVMLAVADPTASPILRATVNVCGPEPTFVLLKVNVVLEAPAAICKEPLAGVNVAVAGC
jgi:hypothetical protein